jgi:hypothetical protein
LKTWEMLLASGQVIGMRVNRMSRAGARPSARDRREFTRMGSEKLEAATQSGWAMAAQIQSAWWHSWLKLMLAGLAPVHRTATANARRLGRGEVRRLTRK